MKAALQTAALYLSEVPCAAAAQVKPKLVLIHGWGCDSRIWQPLVPLLEKSYRVYLLDLPGMGANAPHNPWQDDDLLLQLLADALPEQAHLVGWSLGGNLALEYAARFPQRVLSLSLVATNLSFVARDDWPWGMSPEVFAQFYQQLLDDPVVALRRFGQLQTRGDQQGKALLRQLRALIDTDFNYDAQALADALEWLRARDQRHLLSQLAVQPQFIVGQSDQLVPVPSAAGLTAVSVMPDAGHLPMLSMPAQLAQLLFKSLFESRHQLPTQGADKQRIARSFSKAASSYDAVAGLQRAVGDTLADMLPAEPGAGLALDLGSGTGYFLRKPQTINSPLHWLGGDLAEGMLTYSRSLQPALHGRLLGLDAESLPLADASLRGVYSSLALQWCQHLPLLFEELYRVVRPGGWLAFSTLVDGTLGELKQAWQQVDGHVHVNHFASEQAWRAAAEAAGFHLLRWQPEVRVAHYVQLRDLMHELKALGAHNVNTGMSAGLTGKRSWQILVNAYEPMRLASGELPATWQVLYGVLQRPFIERLQRP